LAASVKALKKEKGRKRESRRESGSLEEGERAHAIEERKA
jgi:hypothetical protein